MDFKAIQNLMKEMNQSELTLLDIESEGIHIKMQKNSNEQSDNKSRAMLESTNIKNNLPLHIPLTLKTDIVQDTADQKPIDDNCKEIVSPIVGTFYEAKGPDKPILANVGDKVKKGQILCIIEAMKLMNEIESDYDGEIIEILVKNEQIVEYGQPLFKICESERK